MKTPNSQYSALFASTRALLVLVLLVLFLGLLSSAPPLRLLSGVLIGLLVGMFWLFFRPEAPLGIGYFTEGDLDSDNRSLRKLWRLCNKLGAELLSNSRKEFDLTSSRADRSAVKVAVAFRFLRPRILRDCVLQAGFERIAKPLRKVSVSSRGANKVLGLLHKVDKALKTAFLRIYTPLNFRTFSVLLEALVENLDILEASSLEKTLQTIERKLSASYFPGRQQGLFKGVVEGYRKRIVLQLEAELVADQLNNMRKGLGTLFSGLDTIKKFVTFSGRHLEIHDGMLPAVVLLISEKVDAAKWQVFISLAVSGRLKKPLTWNRFQRALSGLGSKTDRTLLEAFERQQGSFASAD